jgi:hypothetical protein
MQTVITSIGIFSALLVPSVLSIEMPDKLKLFAVVLLMVVNVFVLIKTKPPKAKSIDARK